MRLQETSIFFQKNRCRHFYCCPYLPLVEGIDTVSRSLLKFKRGAQPDLDTWIGRSLDGFRETPVTLPPGAIIIRALRHKETRPVADPPSSLDRLGEALSRQLDFPYLPHLLYKVRPTSLNQSLTHRQRMAELQNIYQVDLTALPANAAGPGNPSSALPLPANATGPENPSSAKHLPPAVDSPSPQNLPSATNTPTFPNPPSAGTPTFPNLPSAGLPTEPHRPLPTSILLLDDILTTGATVLSILQALHNNFPNCPVTIFTLGKTH